MDGCCYAIYIKILVGPSLLPTMRIDLGLSSSWSLFCLFGCVFPFRHVQFSQMPIAAATGLTTGMLAIHSFADGMDEKELLSAPRDTTVKPLQSCLEAGRMNNSNHVVCYRTTCEMFGFVSSRLRGRLDFFCFVFVGT